jgi:Protein of unknown function (DUF3099)
MAFRRKQRPIRITSAQPGASHGRREREVRYLVMMGTCLLLIGLAWFVVRLYSTTAALVMSAIAVVIPPFAAIVANRR